MFVGSAFLRPAHHAIASGSEPFANFAAPIASGVLGGSLRVVVAYASHSGLASMQIGLMNLVGHSVPERYNYPLLATSPLDFWRRWNTYVNSWLEKYVFIPLTRRLHPKLKTWSKGTALLMTFIASGALHDGYSYASSLSMSTTYLQLFAVSGVAVLVGLAFASARARAGAPARRWWQTFAGPMPRFATLVFLVFAAARWG